MSRELVEKALKISREGITEDAVQFQKSLLDRIVLEDRFSKSGLIAGVDIAYDNDIGFCSIVVVDANTLKPVEKAFFRQKTRFPYIPGLLFYREFPVFYGAYQKLETQPDIMIFDGQGLSHQRSMGIATMSGILLDVPTIGCAKSHLYGNYTIPDTKKFSQTELTVNERVIGYVLRSKDNIKPIFISTGYRISPASSLDIVKRLITTNKLPVPTHLAHQECEKFKKKQPG